MSERPSFESLTPTSFLARSAVVMRKTSGLQWPEGRLAFAGSDLASGSAVWIHGTVDSGHRAARAAKDARHQSTGMTVDKSVQRRRCGLSCHDGRHAVG